MSSSTNTFTNVIPNVTFTATAAQTGVTLTVSNDVDSIANKMQALVDAVNAANSQINTSTAYNTTSQKGSPLTGDSTVRELQSSMLSAVSQGYSGYGSFKQFGLQLDSSGNLTFDKAAFVSAYNANPSAVQDGVSNGLAATFDDIATKASDYADGSLTTAIQSHNNTVSSLNSEISDWDSRLTDKQAALQKQFADLETALGQMKDQSNWLSSQLAGLPTGSG
jgi:flagellar hook-associated protein 2